MDDRTARWIAKAFAIGTPIRGAVLDARGEMGRIWRLDTDRGRFAIKELIHPMDELAAQADVAFQESALGGGLPMPRPIRRPDGAVLTAVETSAGSIATFRAYSWTALADPHRSPTPLVAATLLARLQCLDRPADGAMDPWFSEPLGPDGWASLIDAVRRAGPPWIPAFERLTPLAEEAEAIVSVARLDQRPVAELRHCHLDFNPENVLLDATGQPVVLDWENSGPAPYEQELTSAVLEFAPEPLAAWDFLRAYEAAGGPARVTGSSSFALAVAAQSHLIDTYARRGITAATDVDDRARMADRMDELDRSLFTLASIQRLVDTLVAVRE